MTTPVGDRTGSARRWSLLLPLTLLLLLPMLFGIAVVSADEWPIGTTVALLRVSGTLMGLGAACLVCCHWWVTGSQGSGWLGAAVLALSITQLPSALLELNTATAHAIRTPDTVLDSLLAVPFLVLLMGGTGTRAFRRRIAPVLLGTAVGAAFAGLRITYTALDLETWLGTPESSWVVRTVSAALVGAAVVGVLRRMRTLPTWVRNESILAALAITVARIGRQDAFGGAGPWDVAAGAMLLAGFLLFATTAAELLREGLSDKERQLEGSLRRVTLAEQERRREEETRHELRGAIAGIGSASRILTGMSDGLAPEQRRRLAELISLEMDRMEHLLTSTRTAPSLVALDPVIVKLASAYRYFGVPIRWDPCGVSAWTVPSDLTEVLHVLFSNMARHAPGATASLSARPVDDHVELRISDDGPGIPRALRHQVFERGIRRSDSPGQGLGLYIARSLLTQHGGSLELADDAPRGAAFVLGLPLREPA